MKTKDIIIKRRVLLAPGKVGVPQKEYAVDEKLANYLIAIGKAKPAGGKPGADKPAPTIDEIVIAIEQLDKDDDALWTSDDKPQVDALSKALGVKITADVRDEAFEAYTASLAE